MADQSSTGTSDDVLSHLQINASIEDDDRRSIEMNSLNIQTNDQQPDRKINAPIPDDDRQSSGMNRPNIPINRRENDQQPESEAKTRRQQDDDRRSIEMNSLNIQTNDQQPDRKINAPIPDDDRQSSGMNRPNIPINRRENDQQPESEAKTRRQQDDDRRSIEMNSLNIQTNDQQPDRKINAPIPDDDRQSSGMNRPNIPINRRENDQQPESEAKTRRQQDQFPDILVILFRLSVYSPIKWTDKRCKWSSCHVLWLVIHGFKLGFLTFLTINIGNCRETFATTVNEEYTTLQHTLLKGWDASFETLPYPPAHGQFASYTTDDLKSRIDYTVSQIYNIEAKANGYYKRLPGENISIIINYYNIVTDHNGADPKVDFEGIRSFEPSFGLSTFTNKDNLTEYKYDVTKELVKRNLSSILQRMLMLNVKFALYSLKVDLENKKTRCLHIDGNVSFKNNGNNGQVVIKLTTLTFPIKCQSSTNIQKQCEVDFTYLLIASMASVTTFFDVLALCIGLGILGYACCCKSYPFTECFSNIQWWNLVSIVGDSCSIAGIVQILKMLTEQSEKEHVSLSKWDDNLALLGSGCLLTWISVVRFFRIHSKFTLLVKTLQKAAGDIIFFLIWVVLIFIGFWLYCYIVLGPYHIKFQKMSTAAETLFSIINGDEIFATFANLQEEYVGNTTNIYVLSRIAIYTYVSLFTILVLNLLIALFNSAYEVVKDNSKKSSNLRECAENTSNTNTLRDKLTTTRKETTLLSVLFPIDCCKSENEIA